MTDRVVIGVDSSTTACKAIAWDKQGRAVAEGRATYPLLRPHPTWFEQDAEDWWRSICIALTERAVLEGIAFEQRLAGDGVMAITGQPFSEYVTLGGGSQSKLWCQIMADVTGIAIVRSTTTEATCLGAGILAATAAGWFSDAYQAAAAMTATADRFTPDPATRQYYNRLYTEVYKELFPTLQSLLNRLTELKE